MIDKVRRFINKHELLSAGDVVVVGVSGGPDSIALLHVLWHLSPEYGCKIVVAHVNHRLRVEAEEEESFVRGICKKVGLPYYCAIKDIHDLARQYKTSLEDAGRIARYEFFREIADKVGADCIATAHHQGDVAETVLLHLFRGTGTRGLRGILPRNGKIIRPLLDINKEEILSYLSKNALEYRTDQSNNSNDYVRNRIRNQLIPYLQASFNPRIVENLWQLARISADENQVLEDQVLQGWNSVVDSQDCSKIIFHREAFLDLPAAIQRRFVQKAFTDLAGGAEWTLSDVEKVMDLSKKQGSSKVLQLKKNIKVNLSYDRIIFTSKLLQSSRFCYRIKIPGQIVIRETEEIFSFQLCPKQNYVPATGETYLDYEHLRLPLCLRSRRDGDGFRPLGMQGSKKVKDYFIDSKVPFFDRNKIALLASEEGEIYAIPGMRVAEEAAVSASTQTILVIKKQ